MLAQQAVLLVGGLSNKLYPLTSPSTPKALLHVGNQPLVSFPVKLLEQGGIKEIFLVCVLGPSTESACWTTCLKDYCMQICPGESIASKITSWAKSYSGQAHLEVTHCRRLHSGSLLLNDYYCLERNGSHVVSAAVSFITDLGI